MTPAKPIEAGCIAWFTYDNWQITTVGERICPMEKGGGYLWSLETPLVNKRGVEFWDCPESLLLRIDPPDEQTMRDTAENLERFVT